MSTRAMITATKFQSTLPVRGVTPALADRVGTPEISIHTPREGSDRGIVKRFPAIPNFNPRSP